MKEFASVYYNMSDGEAGERGPWNSEPGFDYREAQPAVDGGSGMAEVGLMKSEKSAIDQLAIRTRSDPQSDPCTRAELGMDSASGAGGDAAKTSSPAPKTGSSGAPGRGSKSKP
ncbi:manganese catalase family protein [Aromatoleum aromaticum]|uniref:Uncharacterized protein n=1 Tax=Aromatoleum aromaticum (strain DSM 19018 / LMG 30748 / EbN1) TaxID=76114 RepID=Q5P1X2_AROAE|nr:hypothetical protein [Aromatoleum aromaticum]CAI08692.1 hypothetical protein ebB152 [Aromatoleum aromaticum EbN1]